MSSSQSLLPEHSPKEEKPSLEEKTMCYAVVAIKSGAAKEKLINYLMNNGFDDMMFVNDLCDHPFSKVSSTRSASEHTDRPSTSQSSTDCEEWKTAATQSSAPKLCQVGGPKRTTRRRCVNCYKNLSK
ncbi:hypothetical protein GCK32_004899 [Trichostrongylus colubriformis]|uniref:Uncharacterized protein n=1 Tax=Trichostrongylus colubriformis TaxID=6319 RepID=A0AAN8FY36_TRICO